MNPNHKPKTWSVWSTLLATIAIQQKLDVNKQMCKPPEHHSPHFILHIFIFYIIILFALTVAVFFVVVIRSRRLVGIVCGRWIFIGCGGGAYSGCHGNRSVCAAGEILCTWWSCCWCLQPSRSIQGFQTFAVCFLFVRTMHTNLVIVTFKVPAYKKILGRTYEKLRTAYDKVWLRKIVGWVCDLQRILGKNLGRTHAKLKINLGRLSMT